MKKTYYILILILVFLLCSCTAPKDAGGFGEKDLIFAYNGESYPLDSDAEPLLDVLGESYEMTEAVSCMFEGMDRTFEYEDAIITTYPAGDKNLMDEIVLMSDRFSTSRGITVGSAKQDVIAAYGEGYTDDGMVLTYKLDPEDMFSPQLYFAFRDDKVASFSFYNPTDPN